MFIIYGKRNATIHKKYTQAINYSQHKVLYFSLFLFSLRLLICIYQKRNNERINPSTIIQIKNITDTISINNYKDSKKSRHKPALLLP